MQIFGQSHSAAIGAVADGLPAGIEIDFDALAAFMLRRAPGLSATSTARKEPDTVEILSGAVGNTTCGAPLSLIIRNTDTKSGDYSEIRDIPRPSHADYAAEMKFGGHQDVSGGGHFSGRLTAPLCAVGGICLQVLQKQGVSINAKISQIGKVTDSSQFESEILRVKQLGDSVGGIIECVADGVRAGLGSPIFNGIENAIAKIIFGIPGVKGIEFGSGFKGAESLGSQNNDEFFVNESGEIRTATNNSGGINGGITNSMPIIFRAAIKPTPSIGLEQRSVSLSKRENTILRIKGRHDPCIVPRAVVCVEAAAAIALYDFYLGRE